MPIVCATNTLPHADACEVGAFTSQGRRATQGIGLIVALVLLLAGCDAWVGPDQRVARAEEHLAKGDHRAAMAQLKTALQSEPGHSAARLALAKLSLWLGDLNAARAELDRAVAAGATEDARNLQYELLLAQREFDAAAALVAHDNETPPLRRLVIEGRIASGAGDPQRAAEKFDEALALAPDDPQALLESARLAAAQGDPQRALDLPGRLGPQGELYAQALHLRGVVLMSKGEHQRAREALVQAQKAGSRLRVPEQLALAAARTEVELALGDAAAAERSLAALTRWGDGSLFAHYMKARVAMVRQDYTVVIAECQRVLRIDESHAQAQLLLAAAHLAQGSLEQAQDALSRLLAANAGNLAARKLLAQVYLARNQPQRAQQLLASAEGVLTDHEADWLMGSAMLHSGSVSDGLRRLERSVEAQPANAARRLDLASAYIGARMPQEAIEQISAAAADASLAPRARALLVLATAMGKPAAEARRDVERLALERADDPALAALAGSFLSSSGDSVAGRRLLERALQLDPRGVEARLSLARMDAAAGRSADAQTRLLEVVAIDPQHQGARLALAELAWSAGERAQARKWLEQAISAHPAAVDARLRLAQLDFLEGAAGRARSLIQQALDVAKDRRAAALTGAGRVLARAGLSDEALARFREAAAAGDLAGTLEAARLQIELDQPGPARHTLETALKDNPNWREAQRLLALIDAREGKMPQAIERIAKLTEDRSLAAKHAAEGDLYIAGGDLEAALNAYEAAQRQRPSSQIALKIFNVRRAAGAVEPERSLTQWLARRPDDTDVRRVLAVHYESLGRSAAAIEQYEYLLAAGRTDAPMLNNLAWMLHQRGDARAIDLARQAYEAAPHVPQIADTYGWILVRIDKFAEGLDVLQKALAAAPADPDIQFHVAFAYARSGRTERAIELLQQSLRQQSFASRADALELLQSLSAPDVAQTRDSNSSP